MRMNRPRRGYSLVELIVSMAILGIVGGILAQIMMGQQRFFQRTVEQQSIRRELRTSINLLPTELRGLSSSGGDLVTFTSSSVTFRSTIGTSIVCAKTGTTTIDVPPLSAAKTIMTAWYTAPIAGDTLFTMYSDSSGAKGDYWSAHRITSVATATSYCAGSAYLDATNDAGKSRYRYVVTPALPDSVVAGSPIRFSRTGRYSLLQQSSGSFYLTRTEYLSGAWGTGVPVSGPFQAPGNSGAGGLTFTFYDSTGAAVASAANASKVARMDVMMRAQGRSSSGTFGGASNSIIDSLTFRIALRNRR